MTNPHESPDASAPADRNSDAILWALTTNAPGAAEFGLLTYLAIQADAEFGHILSVKAVARDLRSSTNTVSKALKRLADVNLIVIEVLDKVDGVYQAGASKRVLLNHPDAPHMTSELVAERAMARQRCDELRASMSETVWDELKPQSGRGAGIRADAAETDARMIATSHTRGGLRLLRPAAPGHPTSTGTEGERRQAAR
ncbi:hypothetical protein BS329_15620 [Amycolatopsis coloradensis]|uniref:Uncharacterized protein n=1 Tax=Amycolatopsis coloradensis TaxID=76021 RepID=A0A1R0KU85_9PSEU|nr:hypothetical protein [Amycolatopsis coloradensis]OLZ51692.1 hypothetical protein BS329_15620 [Amycolatopsis coloradensis]